MVLSLVLSSGENQVRSGQLPVGTTNSFLRKSFSFSSWFTNVYNVVVVTSNPLAYSKIEVSAVLTTAGPSEELWAARRSLITRLYLTESRPLKEVIDVLGKDGFKARYYTSRLPPCVSPL